MVKRLQGSYFTGCASETAVELGSGALLYAITAMRWLGGVMQVMSHAVAQAQAQALHKGSSLV